MREATVGLTKRRKSFRDSGGRFQKSLEYMSPYYLYTFETRVIVSEVGLMEVYLHSSFWSRLFNIEVILAKWNIN